MSFTCRADMCDGTGLLGNYALNSQSSVQKVVNGGSRFASLRAVAQACLTERTRGINSVRVLAVEQPQAGQSNDL